MADDKIVISAIARVVDLATGPLRGIQGAIAGVASTAAKTSAVVGEMGMAVGATVGAVGSKLGAATGKVAGFTRSMAGMFGPVSGLIGLAGIGGLTANLTAFIDKTKELSKSAARFGVTTDALQAMHFALGGSEQAEAGLVKLSKALVTVKKGGKAAEPLITAMSKMGISAKEMQEGNLETLMPKIMEGFATQTNPVVRAGAAFAFFGRSGMQMIPFLVKGAAHMREMTELSKELGVSVEDIKLGGEAAKSMKLLGWAVEAAKNSIAAALLPAFVPMVKTLFEWIRANRQLLRAAALPLFIGLITTAVTSLGVALLSVLGPWSLLVGALVAGGVAIYQNWGSIISWLDKNIPGLTSTISKAVTQTAGFARNAANHIMLAFKNDGLAGGIAASVEMFKIALSNIGEWFAGLFRNVNWGEVGTTAGQLISQALMAIVRSQIDLGKFIIDQFLALHAWLLTVNWTDVGELIGQVIGLAFYAAARIAMAPMQLGALIANEMIAGMKGGDWGSVAKQILLFFLKLPLQMGAIGEQMIQGMIKGAWKAIPGAEALGNAVQTFTQIRVPNAVKDFADTVNNSGAFLGGGPTLNPYANVLSGAGVGPQPAKVESETKIQIQLAPGTTATATTEQTGGSPAQVNIGPAGGGMYMP
jgi:hypothetical protein